jgi:hypothetical protein
MKKTLLAILMITSAVISSFAGGLLTNSNQSVQFVRMPSRNASTQIDAVYFNPAGLIKLEDGWHFSLNNQTISQNKTVYSTFPLLNNKNYLGKVKVPVFPTAFAVFKKDRLAVSLGFGPNAGGGSANFETGLPSFEIPISKVVPGLSGLKALGYDVSNYNAKIQFEGSSIFWGIQLGATFKINDIFSVYGGARYMPSTNTYSGTIKDISVKVNGTYLKAADFLPQVGNVLKTNATALSAAATGLQPLVAAAGSATLAQLVAAGNLPEANRNALITNLVNLGVPVATANAMSVTQVQATLNTSATTLNTQGTVLIATGGQLADKEVDTKQTGTGICPIVGVNIAPSDKLNIAVRYEHVTKLKLTNSTKVDNLGLFPDGQKVTSDIPGLLALGIGYKTPVKWLEAMVSYTTYFDKGVSWGYNIRENVHKRTTKRMIDHNYYELALGLIFKVSDRFSFSMGGLTSQPGTADSYQSDFSYSNPSTTFGYGCQWKASDRLTFDAGLLSSFYKDETITYNDSDLPSGKYTDTLGKTTTIFSFGLSYTIFR